ncbi:MAG: Gfo/Idh/MocA family oxidoreductase [Cyclobacteriaceae bacterium]|nr:Gfo/Idh/MocA family oxidoreductase [Cyclobacteriaceae bacterium]
MSRKLRMGMIGGGIGAFIGAVHRIAAGIDGQIELVCGALDIDPERAVQAGKELYLDPARSYRTYDEMFEKESQLPADQRMDFVTIVTPNFVHFDPAKKALEHGFHVVCEKPMTFSTDEALELDRLVKETGLTFALAHTYTGYPMVKQARDMIKAGELGKIRKVVVEYPQGWLSTPLEQTGQQQAAWRTDPKKSGKAGSVGDIGTHAENLAETITGLHVTELSADVTKFVEGRMLDDDANVLLRFENGAKGVLHCSQIAAGEENALNIRVYGEKGGIQWHQHDPNTMYVKWLDKPMEVYRTGNGYMGEAAAAHTRTPAGHPEGYLEAFANIYRGFTKTVQAKISGSKVDPVYSDFPSTHEGVRGMKFIDAVIESGEKNAAWVKLD